MKRLILAVLIILAISGSAYAAVPVQSNGVYVGEATTINIVGATSVVFDGSTVTVTI